MEQDSEGGLRLIKLYIYFINYNHRARTSMGLFYNGESIYYTLLIIGYLHSE